MDYDDNRPWGRGWSALDHMRMYAKADVDENARLYREHFEPRKTLHEFTGEQDGTTVIVFNTKVVVVKENGTVQEFAREYNGVLQDHQCVSSRAG